MNKRIVDADVLIYRIISDSKEIYNTRTESELVYNDTKDILKIINDLALDIDRLAKLLRINKNRKNVNK